MYIQQTVTQPYLPHTSTWATVLLFLFGCMRWVVHLNTHLTQRRDNVSRTHKNRYTHPKRADAIEHHANTIAHLCLTRETNKKKSVHTSRDPRAAAKSQRDRHNWLSRAYRLFSDRVCVCLCVYAPTKTSPLKYTVQKLVCPYAHMSYDRVGEVRGRAAQHVYALRMHHQTVAAPATNTSTQHKRCIVLHTRTHQGCQTRVHPIILQ